MKKQLMKKQLIAGVLLPVVLGLSGVATTAQAAKPEWAEEQPNGKGDKHKSNGAAEQRQDKGNGKSKEYAERRDSDDDKRRDSDERKDHDKRKVDASQRDNGSYADRRMSGDDRDRLLRGVLSDYYGVEYLSDQHRYKSLPPGLRKKLQRGGELPPGWRDKLVQGRVIDADLYRHAEHLPSDLLNRLTGRQDGIELLRVGDRIVRVMEGRGTILDVIDLSDRALGLFD